MEKKSLKDISWDVSEEEYRADSALSYSTLSRFEKEGFGNLSKLFERIETPSLTLGSAVDSIITGGQEEFNDRFVVADYSSPPDSIITIVRALFDMNWEVFRALEDIPESDIISITEQYKYQLNWKPETRAKVIKEKGGDYYNLLFISNNKTLINTDTYQTVCNMVDALKDSEATKWYFQSNSPFDQIERYYQLKFKATFDSVDYRCMADLIVVDFENKTIQPVDLKTSSHYEWDFYASFVTFNYSIQARLYWRIISDNILKDPYFKDFTLKPYKFIVVNKKTLTPLVWDYEDTMKYGDLVYGNNSKIICREPFDLGKELSYYLKESPRVPLNIDCQESNSLVQKLNSM